MASQDYTVTPFIIHSRLILCLPIEASKKLPSRGMSMIKGTINEVPFVTPVEPDGRGSHWFEIDKKMQKEAGVKVGDTVMLCFESTDDWIKPPVPADLKKALKGSPQAKSLWEKITPNAQWDWVRWIRATKQEETRKRRIEVACDKLTKGIKRPCCFNRNACTDPSVSHNWALLEP